MKTLVIISVLLLAGCGEEDLYQINKTAPVQVEKPKTKWKVECQGYFKAGLDNNPREILILTDPHGRKYLAITGCGVTEIRTVSDGDGNTSHKEE